MDQNIARIIDESMVGLSPRTKQIAEYMFANPKATQKEMAAHFGISPQRVSQIVRSNRFLAALPGMARRQIKTMVPKAVKRMGDLMEQNENLEVARKASERVLTETKVLGNDEITVNLTLKDVPNSELTQKLAQFGAVGPVFEAHILDEDMPSDGKSDVTPKNTPNLDAPQQ